MKSKRRSRSSQQRNAPVFFLDRNLGAEKLAGILRPAGFTIVTHRERYGRRQLVEDPEIIADCGEKKNILVTADGDLEFTYAAEIRQAKIAVLVVTDNNDGADKWGARIILAKGDIDLELGRRRKPFAGRVSAEGRITQVRLYYKKKTKRIWIAKKQRSGR